MSPNLFLVMYGCVACSTPIAVLPANDLTRHECNKMATTHTTNFVTSKEKYVVKCEVRGPNDMIWVLHPEWRN